MTITKTKKVANCKRIQQSWNWAPFSKVYSHQWKSLLSNHCGGLGNFSMKKWWNTGWKWWQISEYTLNFDFLSRPEFCKVQQNETHHTTTQYIHAHIHTLSEIINACLPSVSFYIQWRASHLAGSDSEPLTVSYGEGQSNTPQEDRSPHTTPQCLTAGTMESPDKSSYKKI